MFDIIKFYFILFFYIINNVIIMTTVPPGKRTSTPQVNNLSLRYPGRPLMLNRRHIDRDECSADKVKSKQASDSHLFLAIFFSLLFYFFNNAIFGLENRRFSLANRRYLDIDVCSDVCSDIDVCSDVCSDIDVCSADKVKNKQVRHALQIIL